MDIEFSSEEKVVMVKKLQRYFTDELDQDLGQFEAEFLLDFFSKEIGAFYYNRGLYDAQAVLENRFEDLKDSLYEIEKPTAFVR